ncbi:hypothetical protein [Corallococcus macrosporus]|uniref:Ketohydroxyglutarate aldolase n=1 Tax=Corallococcus macrosporus DSM 14697 TaxID=1189310 RepID=A0A250K066_9BACT|nr:hypothetical protein [Corallococcus macrosporus]ATB49494.1 hypothetical protein MYMAC_005139 [Corallococcus macrosporus DSM 14697]
MPGKTSVSVLIDAAPPDRFEDVIARLQAAGLEIEQVLEESGVVLGSAEPDRLPSLSAVRGATVEAQRSVRLSPPDSDIQ